MKKETVRSPLEPSCLASSLLPRLVSCSILFRSPEPKIFISRNRTINSRFNPSCKLIRSINTRLLPAPRAIPTFQTFQLAAKVSSFEAPMADIRKINLNKPSSNDDSMALVVVPPKELTVVRPKALAVVPPKKIVAASSKEIVSSHHQSFYAGTMPTSRLPPSRLSIEGRPRQLEAPKIRIPKELNILPPKPNEVLTEVKMSKFGDATCMKYKSTRFAINGVRALPEQIQVVPPRKRSPASPSSSSGFSEAKRKRMTLGKQIEDLNQENDELKEKIANLTHADTRNKQDLAFLATAIEKLTARIDKNKIKHTGLKSRVNIMCRTIAKELEKSEKSDK